MKDNLLRSENESSIEGRGMVIDGKVARDRSGDLHFFPTKDGEPYRDEDYWTTNSSVPVELDPRWCPDLTWKHKPRPARLRLELL